MAIATYTFQNGDEYPLMPIDLEPVTWDIRHNTTTLVSDSRSQRRLTRQVGGGRIEASFDFPPVKQADAHSLLEFLRYVEGGNVVFAMRMPLMLETSTYADATPALGEYYNIDHITNKNQLVQLLEYEVDTVTPIVRPAVRAGTTPLIRSHNQDTPHLACSLAGPVQRVKYATDGYVRLSIDVVERW